MRYTCRTVMATGKGMQTLLDQQHNRAVKRRFAKQTLATHQPMQALWQQQVWLVPASVTHPSGMLHQTMFCVCLGWPLLSVRPDCALL